MTDKTRLNIEIPIDLQKDIKDYVNKNNTNIREFVTSLIKDKLESPKKSSAKNKKDTNFFFEKRDNITEKFKIAIICGGPSLERGISLNSARSIMDHLLSDNIDIVPFFVDTNRNAYSISKAQLYSNTPSDFDFKLHTTAIPLSEVEFVSKLKETDIVFPVIHGQYGEDGKLQYLLEKNNIPFVGAGSYSCNLAFNKQHASEFLREKGFYVYPFVTLFADRNDNSDKIHRFFELNRLKKAVVKPVNGGSSIGVYCVYSADEAYEKTKELFEKNLGPVLLEPFCVGREFTIIVLENDRNEPVALLPSEIEMKYENYQIFDYRRKYLPTAQTRYFTPARFKNEEIQKIRDNVEDLFKFFNLKDIVRVDGWLLNDGRIWFSDINISAGMEQNSFVFQQASKLGLSHSALLNYLVRHSARRQGIVMPKTEKLSDDRKIINVLFGGSNAEREVSLMSGTNVWLKLRKSKEYKAKPFLLDKEENVWYLPYSYTLNHTVEEIYENCLNAEENNTRTIELSKDITKRLGIDELTLEIPKKMSFNDFCDKCKKDKAFVFLGLHGGIGEDGTIQNKLDEAKLLYNGSDAKASSLSMNKYETGRIIEKMKDPSITSLPKIRFSITDFKGCKNEDYEKFWNDTTKTLSSLSFIIKPEADGSSAGAVRIFGHNDLQTYIDLLNDNAPYIPAYTFKNQKDIVEMPSNKFQMFMLEPFIETDKIVIKNEKMEYNKRSGWIELTAGVIEKDGEYHSFNPSITIAEGEVLTVEEKFQGGTGVNITPPPLEIVSKQMLENTKLAVERAAKALGIKNYARLDLFLNTNTGKIILIEANTLPALTPSTVIYQQALAENPQLYPKDFLELIIDLKYNKRNLK